jgi:hypothetical protein
VNTNSIYAKTAWAGTSVEVPVLNPGDWFGRTWLVHAKLRTGQTELLIVEAEDPELVRHLLRLEDGYQSWLSTEVELSIHGQPRKQMPWKCRYFGDTLPPRGLSPLQFFDGVSDD